MKTATMAGHGSLQTRQPDQLDTIRNRFISKFPDHISYLSALEERTEAEPSVPVLRDISERSHRIAGVAPTLGFQAIGETAAALDGVISQGLTARRGPSAIWAEARPFLLLLLSEMRKKT